MVLPKGTAAWAVGTSVNTSQHRHSTWNTWNSRHLHADYGAVHHLRPSRKLEGCGSGLSAAEMNCDCQAMVSFLQVTGENAVSAHHSSPDLNCLYFSQSCSMPCTLLEALTICGNTKQRNNLKGLAQCCSDQCKTGFLSSCISINLTRGSSEIWIVLTLQWFLFAVLGRWRNQCQCRKSWYAASV